MRASTKRILSMLLSALFFVGALVIYANLISPEYQEIQQLRASREAKTQFLREQQEVISRVQAALASFQGAGRLQDTVSLALPLEANVSSLFQQIFSISQLSGVGIRSLGLRELAVDPNGLGTLQISLSLFGPYEGLKTFVRSMETNIRVMDLTQMVVQSDGVQNLLRYDLTINTYHQQ